MNRTKRLLLVAMVVLSLVGVGNSFIVYEKVSGNFYAPCIIGDGCDTVVYSSYATFLGVSLSVWGMLFYAMVCVLSILITFFSSWYRYARSVLLVLLCAGVLFSLYLLGLQIFIIGALCAYCIVSFIDVTILFFLGVAVAWRY